MLESLRQGANGWLAKLLMGLLVLSFVGWGILTRQATGDGGSQTLVQIGGQNITTSEYRRLFAAELKRLEGRTHQNIDTQTAHSLGLDQQVFSGLLVDADARDLNLGISDQALMDRLANQKGLQTADGRFDKDAFRILLRNLEMTEAGYIDVLRRDTVREQLLASVSGGAPAPVSLADAINQYQGEERTLDYFAVPASKVPALGMADEAKLKEFYDDHKDDFRAPEYRVAGVLLASPDDLKATVVVPEDEIKANFEANKATFGVPERRHVQVMSFQDKAAADKAFAALKSGKDFMAVARDMGLADKDVDRGVIVKDQLLDKVAAEAAFKLEKDKVSDPIEGALATSLIRVTEIQPGVVKTYDDVKAGIKDTLAREKAVKQLLDFRAKIEDARGGGTLLKEMPAKFPFKYVALPALDAKGLTADGLPVAPPLPNIAAVLKVAYQSDVGVETEPVDLGKEGWAWVEVKEVKPSRQKTEDEVKAAVEKGYQEVQMAAALSKLAGDLADRANKGEDFAKLAKEAGGDVKTSVGIKRRAPAPADVPPAAVQLSFALPKNSASHVSGTDGQSRIVFRVKDIKPAPAMDDSRKKDLLAALTQQTGSIFESEYIAGLEQTYSFRLDQAQLKQLTGAAQPGDTNPLDQ